MKRVLIVNGPNLNCLGERDPTLYGTDTLAALEETWTTYAEGCGLQLTCRHSNHEGELVAWCQKVSHDFHGLILNPAAYTHTSFALADALAFQRIPIVEVHLSNLFKREKCRHISLTAPMANIFICGLGQRGYILALQALSQLMQEAP